ncbi:oligosaccharide flippase family protein [Flavobacterium qiangtangense]|uniref:Oligosaccharide flippase family protein n=1 Tax=Flavobacterium qiangtangense TaxID=1442595 RepID=A0ABW1PR12_9FLAO
MKIIISKLLNDNVLKYLLSKGIVSLAFRALGVAFGFLVAWMLSFYFKEKIYGAFSLLQTIIQLLAMIFTLGIQNTILIEINKIQPLNIHKATSFLFHVFKLVFFVALIPILFFYFGAPFISAVIFNKPHLSESFKIIALFLPVFLFHELVLYYFIGIKRFLTFGLFMFVVPNLFFIGFVFLLRDSLNGPSEIVLYYALSFLITFIIELLVIIDRKKKFIMEKFSNKKTFFSSLPMMFSGLMGFLISWTDVLMLGAMSTEESVGIYNAAFKIGMFVLIIIASINIVTGPKIAEFFVNGDNQNLKKMIQKSTQLVTLISLPIVSIIVFFSDLLLQFFGESFKSGSLVLIIIAVSTFISAASGNVDQILNLTDNRKLLFKINLIALSVNIVLNYIFIPIYDINGSAIASMISIIILNLTCVYFIKKKLGFYTLI